MMMLDPQQIVDAAKAHGFDVLEADEDMVTLGYRLDAQVWLFAEHDDTVSATIAEGSWSYEGGTEWREYDVHPLRLTEMLSYLTWAEKAEADMWARVDRDFEVLHGDH